MEYEIVKVCAENYPRFDDMIFWRSSGAERAPSAGPVPGWILRELENPDLYVYAACADGRFVGWISLVYIPKVGKWQGRGHVYVDELWAAPPFRGRGLGRALLEKADELCTALDAAGIRLYVNLENPGARRLYERCGYRADGQADFMEKQG